MSIREEEERLTDVEREDPPGLHVRPHVGSVQNRSTWKKINIVAVHNAATFRGDVSIGWSERASRSVITLGRPLIVRAPDSTGTGRRNVQRPQSLCNAA
ncbi:MAG: hypothetical protein R2789_14810 [Microthrixaceae bacterium]